MFFLCFDSTNLLTYVNVTTESSVQDFMVYLKIFHVKFHVDYESFKELNKFWKKSFEEKMFTGPEQKTSSGLQAVEIGQVFGQVKLPSLSGT